MKTFDDLIFEKHPTGDNRVKSLLDLGNDIEISVVGGDNLYGNGVTTFEVGAWSKTLRTFMSMPDGDDISGWNTKEEVTKIINYFENL